MWSRRPGLGKSTAHRLLSALVAGGLVDRDPESRTYFLGYQLVALGEVAANRHGIAELGMDAIGRAGCGDRRHGDVKRAAGAPTRSAFARGVGSYPIKIMTLAVGDRRPLGYGAGSLGAACFSYQLRRYPISSRRMRASRRNIPGSKNTWCSSWSSSAVIKAMRAPMVE